MRKKCQPFPCNLFPCQILSPPSAPSLGVPCEFEKAIVPLVQLTWNAGKDFADSNEQILGDLPPDGEYGCNIIILPNSLCDGLVVVHITQPAGL